MFSNHSYEFIEVLLCERNKTAILIMINDIRCGQCLKSDIDKHSRSPRRSAKRKEVSG